MMFQGKCLLLISILNVEWNLVVGFGGLSCHATGSRKVTTFLKDYTTDVGPSDYDSTDLLPERKEVTVDENEEDALIRDELKRELLLLASVTNRGEYASTDEKNIVIDLVAQLEALNPTAQPASNCEGEWDLCMSSTQFFRSSPFFQTIRVMMKEDVNMANNAFDLHDLATSMSRVGRVRQTIQNRLLMSEVDLEVGLMPGIPLKVKGTVITTAKLAIVSDQKWELQIQSTKVKGSNIPIFNQLLEENLQLELPVGEVYTTVQGSIPIIPMTVRKNNNKEPFLGFPTHARTRTHTGPTRYLFLPILGSILFLVVFLQTLYVDESMRITRDIDDNFFVFTRA